MLAFGCCFNGFIFNGHAKKHFAFKCLQSSATKLIIFQCCVNCQGKTALVQSNNTEAEPMETRRYSWESALGFLHVFSFSVILKCLNRSLTV